MLGDESRGREALQRAEAIASRLGLRKLELDEFPLRHAVVRLGVLGQRVIRLSGIERGRGQQCGGEEDEREEAFHVGGVTNDGINKAVRA